MQLDFRNLQLLMSWVCQMLLHLLMNHRVEFDPRRLKQPKFNVSSQKKNENKIN